MTYELVLGVGWGAELPVDYFVVAARNKDERKVSFDKESFYRINGFFLVQIILTFASMDLSA